MLLDLPLPLWEVEAVVLSPVAAELQFVELCLGAVVLGEAGGEIFKIPASGEKSVWRQSA